MHRVSKQNQPNTANRYSYSMLIASEVTAAALIIQYWTTEVPVAAWITIILVGMHSG